MYSRYLDTFICVADAGSFSKAGEELFISATAVMKKIDRMEEQLGFLLFERTPRGLTLTAAGKSYYHDAKYMIRYAQKARERAANAVPSEKHLIRVGASALNTNVLLLSLQARIEEIAPDLKIEYVYFENTDQNVRRILSSFGKKIDVLLTSYDKGFLGEVECGGTELTRMPLCCAVPNGHALAGKTCLKIEDFYGEELMLVRSGWTTEMDRLRRDIQNNHVQIRIADFESYTMPVLNACINRSSILVINGDPDHRHPMLRVIPVEWDYEMPYGFMHAKEPEEKVVRFLAAVKQAYEEAEEYQLLG